MSKKLSVITIFTLITIAPNAAISEINDEEIKKMCSDEWGDDFEMVAYCREQQRTAGKNWVSFLNAAELGSQAETIINNCISEWSSDYEMLVYCYEQQDKALQSLDVVPEDVPSNIFNVISNKCKSEWGDDFEMVAYCREQQVKAWKKLQ